MLEAPTLLQVSPYFFYYVVVRRAFLDHGIDHRRAADYVGALLSYHLQRQQSASDEPAETVYLTDLLQAVRSARSDEEVFERQTACGNRALFLAGLFPDWIYHRHTYARRPVPLSFYEEMGRQCYGVAARSSPARRHALGDVLEFMSAEFPALRQALNDLVDDHLHLAPRPQTVDTLCRQALYRVRN